jgi:hypothetical protein
VEKGSVDAARAELEAVGERQALRIVELQQRAGLDEGLL